MTDRRDSIDDAQTPPGVPSSSDPAADRSTDTDAADAAADSSTDGVKQSNPSSVPLTEPVSVRVVTAVSAATGVDPIALPPLAEAIDPDAIEDIFNGPSNDHRLAFDYAGTRVTIRPREPVHVEPKDSS